MTGMRALALLPLAPLAPLAATLATLAAGCGPASAPPMTPAAGDDPTSRVAAFASIEDEVMHDLAATDRRFAARARIVPREADLQRVTTAAVVAGDADVAAIDGAIDPFSFDARARGLAAAKKRLGAAPAALPDAAEGAIAKPALESELLRRLVDEESVRLDFERRLPRSASTLVRAMVETWTAPSTPDGAANHDRWVARRLAEVRASLSEKPVAVPRARELDDALDALEHRVDAPGFQASMKEIVLLRDALENPARPAPAESARWDDVARGLGALAGVAGPPEEIDRALANAETRLDKQAEAAVLAANVGADALAKLVALLMFPDAPCADAVAGSPIRAMAAPPERAPACHLRHAITSAGDDEAWAAALVALHDHVVVARWALAVATGAEPLDRAVAGRRLLARHATDVTAHLERIALVRPVVAIAAGMSAAILAPTDRTRDAATVWAGLGDVPFDVVERSIQLRP